MPLQSIRSGTSSSATLIITAYRYVFGLAGLLCAILVWNKCHLSSYSRVWPVPRKLIILLPDTYARMPEIYVV